MANDKLTELVEFLKSGQAEGQIQGASVRLVDPVARPDGWPKALPEPVVFEVNIAGRLETKVPFIVDEHKEKHLLFHDPDKAGGFMVMHDVNMQGVFHHYADAIREQINNGTNPLTGESVPTGTSPNLVVEESSGHIYKMVAVNDSGEIMNDGGAPIGSDRTSILVDPALEIGKVVSGEWLNTNDVEYYSYEHGPLENPAVAALSNGLNDYSHALNLRLIIVQDVSLVDVQGAGVRVYAVDVPEAEPVLAPEGEGLPEAVKAEIAVADAAAAVVLDVPSMQVFFDKDIKGDYPLQDLSDDKSAKYQLSTVFANIEKSFQKIDSLEAGDPEIKGHQEQIAFVFGNIDDSWKGVAEAYIQERMETGTAVPLQKFEDTVAAQISGDVSKAQSVLEGTYEEPVAVVVDVKPLDAERQVSLAQAQQDHSVKKIVKWMDKLNRSVERAENTEPDISKEVWEERRMERPYEDYLEFSKAAAFGGLYPNPDRERMGTIENVLRKVDAVFPDVVQGDLGDLSSVSVDLDALPSSVRSDLKADFVAGLEQLQELVDGHDAIQAGLAQQDGLSQTKPVDQVLPSLGVPVSP